MNELATDAPLTHALIDGGPPALIAELKAQGAWESAEVQDPESYNARPEVRRFAQAVVNQAKLDAQRIKQRAHNEALAPVKRQPLSARILTTAIAEIHGYAPTFRGLPLPGLKLQ